MELTMKANWVERARRVVAAAGLFVMVACGSQTASADNEPANEGGAGEVLARIGELEITRAEVEEAIAQQLQDLDRQRREALEKGLDSAINDALVRLAAAESGVDESDFLQAEVDAKVTPATEAEVDQFYEARKAQIGQPKEAVSGQIRQYLDQTRRQQAYGALIEELKAKHSPEILLEPMRIQLADAPAPAKGPESAPVTIVEFSDFQCPFCSRVIPTLDRITEKYGDKVRLEFRQFPLRSIHPEAQKAAEASLCADDQGKFWEMHDAMFEDQSKLDVADLKSTAAGLELDAAVFDECLDSGRYAERVEADLQAGIGAGVTGTPAMFINGRFLSGAQPLEAISKVIDDELRRSGS